MDFNFVTNRLAVGGGAVRDADLHQLDAAGITHVINLRREEEPAFWRAGLRCLHNGIEDDKQPKETAWFRRSIAFAMITFVEQRKKLYVHCWLGQDRSPSTALAILMAQGIPFPEAWRMIQKARPQVKETYIEDAANAVKELGYV